MAWSRRDFMVGGASAVAAGIVGASSVSCSSEGEAPPAAKKGEEKPEQPMKAMVGACGLSCNACPLLAAGKCKGCASGKEASAEMLAKKPCEVLKCAAKKGIDYCGTGCKMYTQCPKLIGKPYDKAYLEMIGKRMAATA